MVNSEDWGSTEKICLRLLGRTPEEHIIAMNKKMFELFYNIFLTLKKEFGKQWAEKYNKIWGELVETSFKNTKNIMGIKEVKDIETLGRMQVFRWTNYPLTCSIVEQTPDRVVIDATYCPNPFYSPSDCHVNKMEYFKNEAGLVESLSNQIIELEELGQWIEAKVEKSICLGDDVCRLVFQKKKKI